MDSTFLTDKNYITVTLSAGKSFGGRQMWFRGDTFFDKTLRTSGCGVIAAADTLLYRAKINRYECTPPLRGILADEKIDEDEYVAFVRRFAKRFVMPIPGVGMTGFRLALCLNRYFKTYNQQLSASWRLCRFNRDFIGDMRRMLESDMPVIMSVPPRSFFDKGLEMKRKATGKIENYSSHQGHFITITGIECRGEIPYEIEFSSWGRKYLVKYADFVRQFHLLIGAVVCGMMVIKPR